MKRFILFCSILFAWFSLPGLLLADSFRPTVVKNEFLVQTAENIAQPGVLMLLLDDPDTGSPPPSETLPVLDTGQIKCYNNTQEITCPEPGEPFYGQDAHYQPRVPRSYTKLGEGGIELPDNASHIDAEGPWIMTRDNVTGLVWEVKREDRVLQNMINTYTWYDPDADNQGTQNGGECIGSECDTYSYIQALNHPDFEFGGYSDWRLPTRRELCSLINWGQYDPVLDTGWFPNTVSETYWASTTAASDTNFIWMLLSTAGHVARSHHQVGRHVLAVYGDFLPNSNFVDNLDGTVTDQATGLMWQKCSMGQTWTGAECTEDPESLTWEQALAQAEVLEFADYNDWRLPDINELQTIVDGTEHNPAVDPLFSENTEPIDYWSSTTFSNAAKGAWHVHFEHGLVNDSDKSVSNYYVRAVRTVTD